MILLFFSSSVQHMLMLTVLNSNGGCEIFLLGMRCKRVVFGGGTTNDLEESVTSSSCLRVTLSLEYG